MKPGKVAFHITWVYLAVCAFIGVFFGLFGAAGGLVGGADVAIAGGLTFFFVTFLGMLLNFLPVYLIVLVIGVVLAAMANRSS
jgi:hypothetical protein